MTNKVMVIVYIPMLEKEYDMYIPTVKKVGTVKGLIIKIIEELSNGTFQGNNTMYLYDKTSGEKIKDDIFIKDSIIVNGSKLILF